MSQIFPVTSSKSSLWASGKSFPEIKAVIE
jgi:hypothetical protein